MSWCRWDVLVVSVGWCDVARANVWTLCGSVQDWLQIPCFFLVCCTKLRISPKSLSFSWLDNLEALIVLMMTSAAIVLTVIVLRRWFSAIEACCRLAIHPWPIPTHEAGPWVGQLTKLHYSYPQETLECDPGLKPGNGAETPMIRWWSYDLLAGCLTDWLHCLRGSLVVDCYSMQSITTPCSIDKLV